MASSVGTDQTPHSVASDLGLHCLLRPFCPNTKGYTLYVYMVKRQGNKKKKMGTSNLNNLISFHPKTQISCIK